MVPIQRVPSEVSRRKRTVPLVSFTLRKESDPATILYKPPIVPTQRVPSRVWTMDLTRFWLPSPCKRYSCAVLPLRHNSFEPPTHKRPWLSSRMACTATKGTLFPLSTRSIRSPENRNNPSSVPIQISPRSEEHTSELQSP